MVVTFTIFIRRKWIFIYFNTKVDYLILNILTNYVILDFYDFYIYDFIYKKNTQRYVNTDPIHFK